MVCIWQVIGGESFAGRGITFTFDAKDSLKRFYHLGFQMHHDLVEQRNHTWQTHYYVCTYIRTYAQLHSGKLPTIIINSLFSCHLVVVF